MVSMKGVLAAAKNSGSLVRSGEGDEKAAYEDVCIFTVGFHFDLYLNSRSSY